MLYYYLGGCLVLLLGVVILLWKFSRKDITLNEERENAKIIRLDEHEYSISGDYPPLKKVQEN